MTRFGLALAVLLGHSLIAQAQEPCWPDAYWYDYCPVSYYWVPAPICYPVEVMPCQPAIQVPPSSQPSAQPPLDTRPNAPRLAPPTAAPPSDRPKSQTSLSPPANGSDSESGAWYDLFPVASRQSERPARDRCDAAFWNLTDRDLVLHVDGQTLDVLRGKSQSARLDREFVWQVEGRDSKREKLGKDESGLEIVIRR